MSRITEELEELDDGTRTLSELAEIIDCSPSYICHLRRNWQMKHKRKEDDRHCVRCDFIATKKVPFVEGTWVKQDDTFIKLDNGNNPEGSGPLCLWCWLDVKGINHKQFYESGAWMNYVDWRPGQAESLERMVEALREQVGYAMEERGHTPREAALSIGCNINSWKTFLSYEGGEGLGAVTAEAVARYLGIEPNAKGLAERFGLHPREVAIFVPGW